jgi:probable addiction module antidote protein
MAKGRPFDELLAEELSDPEMASAYLNDARRESREAFLMALADVVKVAQVSRVAKEAGLQRETLYRSLSEQGNPTHWTLSSVLDVLELDFEIVPKKKPKVFAGIPRDLPEEPDVATSITGIRNSDGEQASGMGKGEAGLLSPNYAFGQQNAVMSIGACQ